MRTAFAAVALVAVMVTGCTRPTAHAIQAGPRFAGVSATLPADHADQGVTTVNGRTVTRGHGDFTVPLVRQGYLHIGDPDARDGYVLDVFEKNSGNVKLFRWTAPDGRQVFWTHVDAAGEMRNNSFAAISPDGRWFVSGEWGSESRLLVFALPGSRSIPGAGTIELSRPVSNIQGCDFATPTVLYCAAASGLFPVTLNHPLDGSPATGTVGSFVSIPAAGDCVGGAFEPEGVDVTGGVITVSVNTPAACYPQSMLYRFVLP